MKFVILGDSSEIIVSQYGDDKLKYALVGDKPGFGGLRLSLVLEVLAEVIILRLHNHLLIV